MTNRLSVLLALILLAVDVHAASRRRPSLPVVQPATGCVPLTLAQTFSQDVEVDADYVYYGDDSGGVFRVPKNGGTPQLLASITPDIVGLLAIDDTTLFILATSDTGDIGSIVAIPKSGGTPNGLVDGIANPFDFAIDGTSVYWTSLGTAFGQELDVDGSVGKVSKDGTGPVILAKNLNAPMSVASDGTNVYFGEVGLSPFNNSAGLRVVPKAGGTVRSLASGPTASVMLKDNDVYYEMLDFTAGGGELLKMPKSGGSSTSLSKGLDFVTEMLPAGDRLYLFDTGNSDRIEWLPIGGGSRTVLQSGDFAAPVFALDDCGVYFVDGALNLRRTPR